MRLQICRIRFNFDPAARRLRALFVPAVWQGYAKPSSFTFKSDGSDSYRSYFNRNIKSVDTKIDKW
jgi:hypothetical protein